MAKDDGYNSNVERDCHSAKRGVNVIPASRITALHVTGQMSRSYGHSSLLSRPYGNVLKPAGAGASGAEGRSGKVVDLHPERDGRSLRQIHPTAYNSWRGMKDRVKTEGAVVHERWLKFVTFFEDMGPKPRGDYSLDRIDSTNPMYGPGLCEWRDKKQQSRNRSSTHYLTDKHGRTMTLPAWAELVGTKANTLRQRKRRGWPDNWVIHGKPEEARVTPDDAIDRLPYIVAGGREAKLRWERLYIERRWVGEERMEYQRRRVSEHLEMLRDWLPNPDPDVMPSPQEMEADREFDKWAGLLTRIETVVASGREAKVARLQKERHVERMLRQPDKTSGGGRRRRCTTPCAT